MAPKKKNNRKIPVKRYHAYAVFLFIMGTLFPPLAVAARFGFGKDFWLNLLLTICGYIPGHGHNFYIQNIRNNKNHRRTPKWAQRYGLVNTDKIQRNERKSQWATRYNDRLPQSAHEAQPYEEGQEHGSNLDISSEEQAARQQREANEGLWRPSDETYYGDQREGSNNTSNTESSGRWHYPANFEDAVPSGDGSKRKKKEKKDRWARTEDAYSFSEERSRKKKTKKRKSKSSEATFQVDESTEFPEDPEGGLYGDRGRQLEETDAVQSGENVFEHQF